MKIYEYLKILRSYKRILPKQTIRTLKGQALSGDLTGAIKGLTRVMNEKGGQNEIHYINRQRPKR
ncbi:MAG: hypothetical protein HGA49_00195 [Eubacteriaceae bacterium]|nr:hypothetical protein [Eubacteriaceae bacterium]